MSWKAETELLAASASISPRPAAVPRRRRRMCSSSLRGDAGTRVYLRDVARRAVARRDVARRAKSREHDGSHQTSPGCAGSGLRIVSDLTQAADDPGSRASNAPAYFARSSRLALVSRTTQTRPASNGSPSPAIATACRSASVTFSLLDLAA